MGLIRGHETRSYAILRNIAVLIPHHSCLKGESFCRGLKTLPGNDTHTDVYSSVEGMGLVWANACSQSFAGARPSWQSGLVLQQAF